MTVDVLVTGFGPFPGVDENPTAWLARGLDGATLAGRRVAGRALPTAWAEAWPTLRAAVAAVEPRALIMLGVATGRARIEVERVARNRCAARVDHAGCGPDGDAVVLGGPATLPTRLPWRDLVGADVGVSDDAGDYLCNLVFYRALHDLALPLVGFVHVPPAPDEAAVWRLVERVAAALHDHPGRPDQPA